MAKLIKFLTHEDVRQLIKKAKRKEVKMALALGAGSGLRISEIVGQRKRVTKCCEADKIRKILIDRRTNKKRKIYRCEKCGMEVKQGDMILSKTKEWDIPPLTEDRVNLKEHQIKIIQGKGKKDRVTVASPWLNETNIKILPIKMPIRTLQYQFNQLTKKVLGETWNFHSLRHSFGNYMVVEKNVPITIVQQLMGHSRIDTTSLYSKANPKQAIEQAWDAF